jgi:four helix bundle protein
MNTVVKEKITSFRQLEIWKYGKNIALEVYRVTKNFPKEEVYGLVSQMRRAAISISANIAEGFSRFHNKEYKQFLFISLGSCSELETFIDISFDLGFLSALDAENLQALLVSESKMIRALIKKLN